MKHLPDAVRWHIKERERTSKKEALYISQVIRSFQRKLKKKYTSILDVACGNGRLHPFLRRQGFQVFGIDNSKELIKEVRKKYPRFYDEYKRTDIRKFDLKNKFDVALSWFTSFGYFGDKENLDVLKNVRRHLQKDGLFLLDIPNGPVRINQLRSDPTYISTTGNFVEIVGNKPVRIKNQTFWDLEQTFYLKEGKDLKFLKRETRKIRIYSVPEITKLLDKAGFKVVQILNSMSLKQVDEKTRQMFVVAQKTKSKI